MNQLITKINTLDIKKKGRPTFYTRSNKPIRAGGVLFIKNGNYLLQKKNNCQFSDLGGKTQNCQFSDLGGKTDISDNDIIDTIIREVKEETNNQINITRNTLKKAKIKYLSESKYLLFIIKTKYNFKKEISLMGDTEDHSNINRTVNWYNPSYTQYHPRLKHYFK
jgi:hypothetical protein